MCQYCDKTFDTFEEMKKHIISHNTGENEDQQFETLMCDKCCNCFLSMEELNLHIKVVHEKEENEQRQALLCNKCFECFESERINI